ncbi:MAG: VWA domain-containing protein [Dehalococcoidia bacterium]|nr:VWA domain-containing protein [Dehalococcoidia bacterium]
MRRTVRASRRFGGDAVQLAWQRRKLRKLRVVALCDVSGSMDTYSGFLLQFLYALQNEVGGVHTFAFSTRLYNLTPTLRRKRFDEMLERLHGTIDTWSGGTSIGESLADFNANWAPSIVSPRTVVIIASDGWERGEVDTLRREMAALSRRAYRVIWMNPLKGHEGYQPLAAGISAALPYVDHFLPANTLASFEQLRRTLLHIA